MLVFQNINPSGPLTVEKVTTLCVLPLEESFICSTIQYSMFIESRSCLYFSNPDTGKPVIS